MAVCRNRTWAWSVRRSLVLALAAVLVAGCGSSGGQSDPAATPTGDATTQPAEAAEAAGATGEGSPATNSVGEPVGFADHLSVGDCWNDARDADGDLDYSGPPDVVDCDEPHDNEVMAVWLVGDDAYPGDDALDAQAEDVCGGAFEGFVGASYGDTAVDGFANWPEKADWEAGARQGACSVYLPDALVRGSLEGVGVHPRPHDYPSDSPIPSSAVLQRTGVTDEGDRLMAFDVEMDRDSAADAIAAAAAEIGWTLDARGGASRTVVLEFSHEGTEYTVAVTAPEDATEATSIAYYYPADPAGS